MILYWKMSIRELAFPRLFSSTFFGWSILCDSFPYLHSSGYLLFYTPDLFKLYTNVICQVHSSGKHISIVHSLPTIKVCLPQWPPFLQHILWQCYNYLGIPSSMVEILLLDLVFHNRVTPVSVSILKPLPGVNRGYTTETLSISYSRKSYIRLVVTL